MDIGERAGRTRGIEGAGRRWRGGLRAVPATAWIVTLLLACLVLPGCARSDPEAALRATLESMQSALERRDAAAMQQHLADDFIGNDGLDRDGARRLAAGYVLRHRTIGISAGPLDVSMTPTHATVRFSAMLRGGSGRALPDAVRIYEVETGWRLEGDDWKLASARWTPAL